MSQKLQDVLNQFEARVPLSWQEPWDVSGLQVGSKDNLISKVLFAYDPCLEVVQKAIEMKAQLIVTHHPLMMSGFKQLDLDRYEGRVLELAVKNDIAIYTAHTNHDASPDSLNHRYADLLHLNKTYPIKSNPSAPAGIGSGLIGYLSQPLDQGELLAQLKTIFKVSELRFAGRSQNKIQKVAICTGSGTGFLQNAIGEECQAFITGDVKYHYAIEAKRHDLLLVDIGHFASEIASVESLENIFQEIFGNHLQTEIYRGLHDPFEKV